jgi:hypothetical protein
MVAVVPKSKREAEKARKRQEKTEKKRAKAAAKKKLAALAADTATPMTRARKTNTKTKKQIFLIVCEGKKTEKHYFDALVAKSPSLVREAEVEGVGKGTMEVVKEAIVLEKKLGRDFDQVWVVFDKDDFKDFNEAIAFAKKQKVRNRKTTYKVAWSNESFELWYCLHFDYYNTAMPRQDYICHIENAIKKHKGQEKFKYDKAGIDMYELLNLYGDEAEAIKRAQKLRALYNDENYAAHNPCTYVDLLVQELKKG